MQSSFDWPDVFRIAKMLKKDAGDLNGTGVGPKDHFGVESGGERFVSGDKPHTGACKETDDVGGSRHREWRKRSEWEGKGEESA
jgi:hypothetical protein